MTRWLWLILLLSVAAPAEPDPRLAVGAPVAGVSSNDVAKPAVDLPFDIGEELIYNVYWGWIHVGTSVASTRWLWQGERWLVEIKLRTKSNSVLTKLYPVDDTIISEVDPITFRPLTFVKILNEGRHHTDEITHFDWEAMEATYQITKKGKTKTGTYEIKDDTRDIATFLSYMRRRPMKENSKYQFGVMADEKLWELEVETGGSKKIKLDAYGKVPSVKVMPRAKFEGIFVRKGDMTIYVSQDERFVMTKMVADTPFANVKLLLHRVRGPGDDDWITKGLEADEKERKNVEGKRSRFRRKR